MGREVCLPVGERPALTGAEAVLLVDHDKAKGAEDD